MAGLKAPAGHFTVLYFAAAGSITQRPQEYLIAPMTIGELFGYLDRTYPGMKDKVISSSAVTINLDYVDVDEVGSDRGLEKNIDDGDEVAIIPPVSSG